MAQSERLSLLFETVQLIIIFNQQAGVTQHFFLTEESNVKRITVTPGSLQKTKLLSQT